MNRKRYLLFQMMKGTCFLGVTLITETVLPAYNNIGCLAPRYNFENQYDQEEFCLVGKFKLFSGIDVDQWITSLKNKYPNYETIPSTEEALFTEIFSVLSDSKIILKGNGYTETDIRNNRGINCVGLTKLSGYIFGELLGYTVFWQNITENVEWRPEAHAALLIETKKIRPDYFTFDPAMKIFKKVQLDPEVEKRIHNYPAEKFNVNFIVEDPQSTEMNHADSESLSIWLKKIKAEEYRYYAALRELYLLTGKPLTKKLSIRFEIHPRGQILPFKDGYNFATQASIGHEQIKDPRNRHKALEIHQEIAKSNSSDYLNLAALGKAYFDNQSPKDSIAFEQALLFSYDHPMALEYRGEIYARKGMYKEALPFLELAFRLNPTSIENTYNLGQTYLDLNLPEKASQYFYFALRTAEITRNTGWFKIIIDCLKSDKIPLAIKLGLKQHQFRSLLQLYQAA